VVLSPGRPARCGPFWSAKSHENETGPAAGDGVAAPSVILSEAKDLIAIAIATAVLVRFS
jgi:hypothetical protein